MYTEANPSAPIIVAGERYTNAGVVLKPLAVGVVGWEGGRGWVGEGE